MAFRRITTRRLLLLLLPLCLLAANPVVAATGVKMDLQYPPTRLSAFFEPQTQPPLSISEKPLPLFKSNMARQVVANYNAEDSLMVVNEYYGNYEHLRIPVAAKATAYQGMVLQRSWQKMWQNSIKAALAKPDEQRTGGLLRIQVPWRVQSRLVKSIIGEGGAGLQVNGYRKITISGKSQWTDQASVATAKQSKFPALNMEQIASFTIKGNIGSKITVDVNQDSKRQQSLANKILLRYKGDEDDIVQDIELGNTNLALPATRFTGYSQSIQGLFGVKMNAQVGALKLTAIASQEKSSNEAATFTAGAESTQRVVRDYQFLDNRFFDLRITGLTPEQMQADTLDDLMPGDSITKLVLYLPSTDQSVAYPCSLYVNPNRRDGHQREALSRLCLSETDYKNVPGNIDPSYTYDPVQHYIIIDRPTISNNSNNYFGVYMEAYRPSTGDTVVIGDEEGVTSEDGTKYRIIKLIKHESPDPSYVTWNYVWRNVYSLGGRIENPDALQVTIYKGQATTVDDIDESELSYRKSDGQSYLHLLGMDVDDDGVIDRSNQIVDYERGLIRFPSRKPFLSAALEGDTVPTIYNSDNSTQLSQDSKYYLLINAAARATDFSLGHFDIVEGSETVMLNGRRLESGVDYRMSYEIGRITFLSQDALDPNANVTVDYEYAPLITAEKKTLLGARAEYTRGRNFKAGTTLLYKSEKTTDRKPRIGEEASRFINLDYDASYSFESQALTEMVDALPLIKTEAPSRVAIAGEVAQSMPNPNVLGEAYIDDFEGASERYSLGVTRGTWHFASPPENAADTTKGKLIWYNPYVQYRVTDVYDRQVQAGEDRIHVLQLQYTPKGDDKRTSWGGVMKALSSGVADQSRTQFVELRVSGKKGVLHLDFGEITEDLNNNGELDTEDKSVPPNGILEEGEDVGLDGFSDDEERENCDCTLEDPAGDDWAYDSNNPNDYSRINGTEGNALDPETYGLPDTEDLNRSGGLDTRNNYYSFRVDLANNPYLVEGSEWKGWYTIRIPFSNENADKIEGTPRRDNIKFARLWLDGTDTTSLVSIAALDFTRNLWELRPVATATDSIRDSITAPVFRAAVVNTEENPDLYTSPPGVVGFYDKTTGITEKEQSLSLQFENFMAGDTGIAVKIPYKRQDLTGYQRLQMWVHGDRDRDSLRYFMRVGNDSLNYYEYQGDIVSGWSEPHSVDMVFDEITQLKLKEQELDTNDVMEGNYRVYGDPSFTKIKYYAVGVIKLGGQELDSGSVWMDELRVTDVRSDAGVAGFVSASVNFADLMSISADYSKEDAFFRKLTSQNRTNLGSGSESANRSFTMNFNADKFLSPSLRARIPISYSWRQSTQVPRLITGSDIAVPADRRDAEKTISTSSSVSVKESFRADSESPVFKYFLNVFSSGVSLQKSNGQTPTQPVNESDKYNANAKYEAPLRRHTGLRILWPLRYIPLMPRGITDADLWPMPTRFSTSGNLDRTKTYSVNSLGKSTSRYTRTFLGKVTTGMEPMPGIQLNYSMDTDRDLEDPELLHFSLTPKGTKLGQERTFRENFSATWSPRLLDFISGTRFSFGANHDENLDPQRQQVAGTRAINNSRNLSLSATFDINKIIGTGGSPAARSRRPRPRQRQQREPIVDTLRTGEEKPPEVEKEEEEKGPSIPIYEYPLRGLRLITKRIDPVSASYKSDKRISRNGFTERPQFLYRWGLSDDPKANVISVETGTGQINSEANSRTHSLGSGVSLPLGVKVATRWAFATSEASNRHLRDETTTFPDLSFDYGDLFILRWTSLFASSFKLESKYTRTEKKSVSKSSGLAESSTISDSYSPFLAATISWRFARSFTTRLNYNTTSNDRRVFLAQGANIGDLNTRTVDHNNTFTVSNAYTFQGGSRIGIPLLGSMRIKANMSLNLDVSYATNRSEKRNPNEEPSETDNKSDLTVQTRASYSFSQNIKGGMTARWRDTTDKKSARNTHGRELGFWVEIRF